MIEWEVLVFCHARCSGAALASDDEVDSVVANRFSVALINGGG